MPKSIMQGEIIDTRVADPDHNVLTVIAGDKAFRRHPCKTCPWRVNQAGMWPAEAFRLTAHFGWTEFPPGADAELLTRVFACHEYGAERPAACAGYVTQGYGGIAWRVALTAGRFKPHLVSIRGAKLFKSFLAMALANGVPADDPALEHCQPQPKRRRISTGRMTG